MLCLLQHCQLSSLPETPRADLGIVSCHPKKRTLTSKTIDIRHSIWMHIVTCKGSTQCVMFFCSFRSLEYGPMCGIPNKNSNQELILTFISTNFFPVGISVWLHSKLHLVSLGVVKTLKSTGKHKTPCEPNILFM